jgi:hypothetical protein
MKKPSNKKVRKARERVITKRDLQEATNKKLKSVSG